MIILKGLICVLIYNAETAEKTVLLDEKRGDGQLCVAGVAFWVPEVENESV